MSYATTTPASGATEVAVVVVALLVQGLVALSTLLLGVGWDGWTWGVGLLQVTAAVVILAWVGRRHALLALLVPVASALVTVGLVALAEGLGHTGF
ncbi:MAG TPA: hypothetical protein VFZ64_00155 [Nocardioidaceae bacterium]